MAVDSRILDLLRALPPGKRLWLSAGGCSMWPFILSGDHLQVERLSPVVLRSGDVAVLLFGEDLLVAHLVADVAPLRTVSSVGVVDPPGAALLGRVVALRRGAVTLPVSAALRPLLRAIPSTAAWLKRVPGARRLVRRLRDGS
jgi:hypothetical protein